MYNEFTLKSQTMWSDGHFNPHRWDYLGFNEYELKHCCFGEDGDQNDAGADPGQGDFTGRGAEEDEGIPDPDDYGGLVAASENGKGYGPGGNVATTAADVPGLVGEAVADMVAMDPYGGVGPNMNDILSGLTPQEIGFGYLSQEQNPLIGHPTERMGRAQLAQTYTDAKAASQDIGSDIASLFGFQSPVMLDKDRGFYEGTSFDPFDAPVLSLLANLNPLTGALYGLTKGLVKNDPIGGALSMIGPYSPLAGVANLATTGMKAHNLFSNTPQTLSSLAGVNSPFGLGKGADPLTVNKFQPEVQGLNIPGYTSTNITFDPIGALQGFGRSIKDSIVNVFDDPRSGAVELDENAKSSVGYDLNLDTTMSRNAPLSVPSLDRAVSPEKEISGMYGNWLELEPEPVSPELGFSSAEQDAINHVISNNAVFQNNSDGSLTNFARGGYPVESVTTEPIILR